mmetsp:Transcript_5543/g.12935  ORF Transcript_5543/g.12935 Transcript_5543/m.12935 type:complete len:288 (-) Transcript_5543:424-1287(-)
MHRPESTTDPADDCFAMFCQFRSTWGWRISPLKVLVGLHVQQRALRLRLSSKCLGRSGGSCPVPPLPNQLLVDLLVLGGQGTTGDFHRLINQAPLDILIKRGIGGEAWQVVDLNEVRLPALIEHHIDTQDLEAPAPEVASRQVSREGACVFRFQRWLHGEQRLHTEPHELQPQLPSLFLPVLFLDTVQEPPQRPFAARFVVICRLEVLAVLVHRVVGQVHAPLVHRLGCRRRVVRCAETHQAIAEEEHAQVEATALRQLATYEEIEPQVKLEALNQHWPGDVPLHNC